MTSDTPENAQTGTYGNFQNPLGLVFRMLRSGRRSARAALFREALRLVLTPADFLMSIVERRKLATTDAVRQPIVLVVGPPRCGTTLVYQVLARYCDVTYLTNLSALFPRSPLTATQWFGCTTHKVSAIKSYYGQTARLCDPNDGFHVWNRWLGNDRYRTLQVLSDTSVAEMNQFFGAWAATFPKPFLNKNNRNAECIRLHAQSLDDAYFVVVRRDMMTAARSLIRARHEVQGDKITPWGLRSRRTKGERDPLGYVDDVCDQLADIESDIQEQLQGIRNTHQIELRYEDFCDNPHSVLEQLRETVPGLLLKQSLIDSELTAFKRSAGSELSAAEEARIADCLARAAIH